MTLVWSLVHAYVDTLTVAVLAVGLSYVIPVDIYLRVTNPALCNDKLVSVLLAQACPRDDNHHTNIINSIVFSVAVWLIPYPGCNSSTNSGWRFDGLISTLFSLCSITQFTLSTSNPVPTGIPVSVLFYVGVRLMLCPGYITCYPGNI